MRKSLLLCSILLLVLCARTRNAGAANPTRTLDVFAAASLSEAFRELGTRFEGEHPGIKVRFNFAGSQVLAMQLDQGAPADVFASADQRWMDHASRRALLDGAAREFARNRLVVIVPKTNPARIGRLQDLARGGVKVVLGAEAVPVGQYSRVVLRNLATDPAFGAAFAGRVLRNVVSQEENVKSVVGKVQLGEADAGFVYRSDITSSVARYLRVLPIPEAANVLTSYPIALVKGSRENDLAAAFVEAVLAPEGQRILERHGLIPVAGRP